MYQDFVFVNILYIFLINGCLCAELLKNVGYTIKLTTA